MTTQAVWYFEETPTYVALAEFAHRKHNLKTAWAGLKTLPRYEVKIVYPAPWNVAPGLLDAWMDYYLECIGLQQEYPARVMLFPLDVWLSEQGFRDPELGDDQSLKAFLLRNQRPDLFELTAALESVACLQAKGQGSARQPWMAAPSRELSHEQLRRLSDLLEQIGAMAQLREDVLGLKSANQSLQSQCEQLRQRHEQEQIALAVKLEKETVSRDAKIKDLESRCNTIDEKRKEVIEKSKGLENRIRDLEPRCKAAESRLKDAVNENAAILDQLLKVQEILEQQQLSNKALKSEAELASSVMQRAATSVLWHVGKQSAGEI